MQNQCQVRGCKDLVVLSYLDHPICKRHWHRVCDLRENVSSDQVASWLSKGQLPKTPPQQSEIKPEAGGTEAKMPRGDVMPRPAKYTYKKGEKTVAGCVIKDTETNDNGKVHILTIQCSHPGCKNTRRIKVQDAFQVRFCEEHRTASSRGEGGRTAKAILKPDAKAKGRTRAKAAAQN